MVKTTTTIKGIIITKSVVKNTGKKDTGIIPVLIPIFQSIIKIISKTNDINTSSVFHLNYLIFH